MKLKIDILIWIKIMKINVYSQDNFRLLGFNDDNVENLTNDYFICINSTGSNNVSMYNVPIFKKKHLNVINLWFDDTEKNKIKIAGDIIYFAIACSINQARMIRNFINDIPIDATVHIYCAKGQSRSPAIRKFIEDYRNLSIKTEYNFYNSYLYELLWK